MIVVEHVVAKSMTRIWPIISFGMFFVVAALAHICDRFNIPTKVKHSARWLVRATLGKFQDQKLFLGLEVVAGPRLGVTPPALLQGMGHPSVDQSFGNQ